MQPALPGFEREVVVQIFDCCVLRIFLSTLEIYSSRSHLDCFQKTFVGDRNVSKKVRWYEERTPEFYEAGRFNALITATSEKSEASNWRGKSSCGIEIDPLDDLEGERARFIYKSKEADSEESRAYAGAVVGVVEALPPGSDADIYTRAEHVARTINEYMPNWVSNGWRNNKGERPKALEIWQRVHEIITERHINLKAHWVSKNDHDLCNQILDLLEDTRKRLKSRADGD